MTTAVTFDVEKIIHRAGGVLELHDLIAKHNKGEAPDLSVIRMWRVRKSISGKWIALVLYAIMQGQGRVFDLLVVRDKS